MNDFRINIFERVANNIGLNKTSYDESTLEICYDGYLHVSFADSKKIVINAICMHIPFEKESIVTTFCQLINSQYSYVNFELVSDYLIAHGGILSSIFMEDEPEQELKSHLENLIEETKGGTRHIYNIVTN